jgi:hypothetical protein
MSVPISVEKHQVIFSDKEKTDRYVHISLLQNKHIGYSVTSSIIYFLN